jgi:hypothetical protein
MQVFGVMACCQRYGMLSQITPDFLGFFKNSLEIKYLNEKIGEVDIRGCCRFLLHK